MPTRAASKPEAGDYLENGSRLVMVLSYNKRDEVLVEDAFSDVVESLPEVKLAEWRRVPRRKRGV